MSKERRRARFASSPQDPDLTDVIASVVDNHENAWLTRVEKWHAIVKGLGMFIQARIYRDMHMDELDRLDPKGHLAVENGDELPKRGGHVDWDNL